MFLGKVEWYEKIIIVQRCTINNTNGYLRVNSRITFANYIENERYFLIILFCTLILTKKNEIFKKITSSFTS